jgi:hypothetical protein
MTHKTQTTKFIRFPLSLKANAKDKKWDIKSQSPIECHFPQVKKNPRGKLVGIGCHRKNPTVKGMHMHEGNSHLVCMAAIL